MKSSEERVGESEFAIDGDLDGVLDTVTELVKEEVKIVQDRWRGEIGQGVIGIGQYVLKLPNGKSLSHLQHLVSFREKGMPIIAVVFVWSNTARPNFSMFYSKQKSSNRRF